jgi:hypothetical protein
MEQEQLTFPEHPSSPPVFNGVCVTRSLVLCVCYVIIVCRKHLWKVLYKASSKQNER